MNQHNQFGLVNPDNRYHLATISTPGTYVIRGKRGTSADLQIQIGAGNAGFDEDLTSPTPIAELSLDDDLLDAGIVFGTGFAPFRGGPMHYLENDPEAIRPTGDSS